MVVNKADYQSINAVSAARVTLGLDTEILELKVPLKLIARMENGIATGDVINWKELVAQVKELEYDALGIATPITIDSQTLATYWRCGSVNPVGGVEALATRLIGEALDKPCAHGPVDYALTGFKEVVDPRIAVEIITENFIHCYRNDGPAGFIPMAGDPLGTSGGLDSALALGDCDNDGHLDVFVSNHEGKNNFLFHNEGDGTFSRVTEGAVANDGGNSWGCAWADYDNDGDLDLFVSNGGYLNPPAPPGEAGFLYRNDGGTNKWLLLKFVGTTSNRSAIGAKVRVLASIGGESFWQMREISGGSGWCSQNDLRVHFGLGDATNVTTLRIEWPSGIVQEIADVPGRQVLTVTEHQGGAIPAPSLTATKSANGMVLLTAAGQTNLRYVFEASTNLAQWTKIAVRTNLPGTVECTPAAAAAPAKFYRVCVP